MFERHPITGQPPLGYSKKGAPIWPVRGGSEPAPEAPPQSTPTGQPAIQLVPSAPEPAPTFTPTGRVFTEAEVEAARKQEKDKLYGTVETLQNDLKALREAEEKRQAEAKAEQERRDAEKAEQERLAKEAAEAEMSAKELLEQQRTEWEQRFQTMQQEREAERQVLALERQFSELQTYKTQALQANSDDIIPELADELLAATHNSTDEIDAHIVRLRDISARIIEQATGAQQQQRQQMRGVPVTAPPALGPTDNPSGYQSLSPADIAGMSAADYAKNRDKILSAVMQGRQSNERGLYG